MCDNKETLEASRQMRAQLDRLIKKLDAIEHRIEQSVRKGTQAAQKRAIR